MSQIISSTNLPGDAPPQFSIRSLFFSIVGIAIGAALAQPLGVRGAIMLAPLLFTLPMVRTLQARIPEETLHKICLYGGYLPYALSFLLPILGSYNSNALLGIFGYMLSWLLLFIAFWDFPNTMLYDTNLLSFVSYFGNIILLAIWAMNPIIVVAWACCYRSKRA